MIINDCNGFVCSFTDDTIISLFSYKESKAIYALKSANQIQESFQTNNLYKTKFGEFKLSIEINLSYGQVNWGIIQCNKTGNYILQLTLSFRF